MLAIGSLLPLATPPLPRFGSRACRHVRPPFVVSQKPRPLIAHVTPPELPTSPIPRLPVSAPLVRFTEPATRPEMRAAVTPPDSTAHIASPRPAAATIPAASSTLRRRPRARASRIRSSGSSCGGGAPPHIPLFVLTPPASPPE